MRFAGCLRAARTVRVQLEYVEEVPRLSRRRPRFGFESLEHASGNARCLEGEAVESHGPASSRAASAEHVLGGPTVAYVVERYLVPAVFTAKISKR